ncbi:hypothetical protein OV450_8179 [Actinobacteria bacterium OV450]|nr:hypothetical protein OV450_8179 [Actinobacteria bacterium OV450]
MTLAKSAAIRQTAGGPRLPAAFPAPPADLQAGPGQEVLGLPQKRPHASAQQTEGLHTTAQPWMSKSLRAPGTGRSAEYGGQDQDASDGRGPTASEAVKRLLDRVEARGRGLLSE